MCLKKISGLIIILTVLFASVSSGQGSDSLGNDVPSVRPGVEGYIATSFMLNRNWKETDNSSLLFALNIKARSNEERSMKRITEFQAEIAYQKFIDSIWVKNTDRIFFSNIYMLSGNKIKHTISVYFTSQIADTWIEKSNGTLMERKWKSGPLLPATVVAGYGIIYRPSGRSYINITFPALKYGSMPVAGQPPGELKIISQTGEYIIYREYGLNLQMNMEKRLTSKITVQNFTSLFVKKTDKRTANLEMINTVSFRLFDGLKARFENKILYDEIISKRLQWKYDFLLGFRFNI